MTLVRIVKDWDWPDLMRQTPGGAGVWDGIRFTLDEVEECDLLLVLNNRLRRAARARVPPGRVWALMQEPYVWGFTDWMVEGHEAFDRVYTNFPVDAGSRYVVSHPALPWHVARTFDELTACPVPPKKFAASWVVGYCRDLPGHMTRLAFLRYLQASGEQRIHLFGRAVKYIEDKWDGLAPYRYSLAVENTVWPDYWTEKIADCFLSWTVPLYHGCPNLERYFPPESFIRIDIARPADALASIRTILDKDDWERRLPALEEARRKVLWDYQLFPYVTRLLKAGGGGGGEERVAVTVPAWRPRGRIRLRRLAYKIKKHGMRLLGPS